MTNPKEDHQALLCEILGVCIRTKDLSDKATQAAESGKRGKQLSFNLAKLRLADLRLHGREDDIKLLNTKLRELKKRVGGHVITDADDPAKARPELLLVTGVSGTGKSALVMRGLRDPAHKMGMVFAGGKFDLNNTGLPLAAFADAISSLTKFVVANDHVHKIRDEIKNEFEEDDMMILLGAMAGCEGLFPIEKWSDTEDTGCNFGGGGKESAMRLQYAIRRLLRVICTNLAGMVLFIDDLQWSDTATLDLLRSISLDTDIPSLLLVGAYRSDLVPDSHPLALHIRELGEQRDVVITTINLKNLSPSNVMSLVADALRMEDNESALETLAKSVHKKTDGNAFFVLMFLRYLYDERLIQYNFGAMKWIWDDVVVSSTMVMQNVATIMVNRLKQFPEGPQNILKVASCLGASFSTSVVAMVMENLLETQSRKISDHDEIASLITSSIDEFEKDGIWEVESESEAIWRFSHDQIQCAAFELIPSDKRDSFRGKVGNALMTRLDPDLLEEFLFEAVALQNYAMPSMSSDERKALAKMNLRAGLKASKNASFESAVIYFKSGRELLERSWEVDPDTMLQLCGEEANARLIANDNLETVNVLIDEVLDQPIPVRDKFRVYEVKVNLALARGDLHECLDTALGFCRKLGLSAPTNKPVSTLIILKEYYKTKRALGNRTADEIACLPELSDERIIMGQKIMSLSAASCYLAQPTLFPIIVFLMVRYSIKYGISASSCDWFATFGLILCGAFGNLKEGLMMAKAAESILTNHDWKERKSRVAMICEAFIFHWTAPLQASFVPFLEGYQIGLCTGDIDSAGWCLVIRCHHLFCAARPLEGLQREIHACIDILSDLNLEAHRMVLLPYLLAVVKLRGVDVPEECMDFEAMVKAATETSNLTSRGHSIFAQLELMVIFKDWKGAAVLLVEADNLRVTMPGHFVGVRFTAFDALISFKAAQSSPFLGRIKWKRRGVKSMKLLRSWVKKGNGNAVHLLYIVSAQLASLEGKRKKAEEGFKSAAKVAARNGLLQDKALAHELAGAHFTAQGDTFWADHHKESSQQAYSDWGAKAKVVVERELGSASDRLDGFA